MPDDNLEVAPGAGFALATAFFESVRRALQEVPTGSDDIFIGTVTNSPVSIFDLNECMLFYDFPIMINSHPIGTVRVAATKSLGNPWIAIQQSPPLDPYAVLKTATNIVASVFPGSEILESTPVCYNYPSIGLFLKIKLTNGEQLFRIFDPYDPHPLIEIPEGGTTPDTKHAEGRCVYSILASLPEGGTPVADFDRFARLVDSVVSEQVGAPVTIAAVEAHRIAEAFRLNASSQREGDDAEKIIDVKLFPQEAQEFCVIACIQMINNFYGGSAISQSEIAQDLEAPPPALFDPDSGVLPSTQTDAFSRILPVGCSVTFDGEPSWQKFVEEIDAGRPFKSGITAHARVAIGYQVQKIAPTNGSNAVIQRSLWINDPAKSAGMMFEPHELAELDPDDPSHVSSVKQRIPFKNNPTAKPPALLERLTAVQH